MLKAKPPVQEDLDPQETAEWLDAFDQVVDETGPDRASYLLDRLTERARASGVPSARRVNTSYINTIPAAEEVPYPGHRD
ncbi:MAG: hypothetical protein M1541_22040, partial [Acidobacteria bacterium]|nr:hypothetical protein [Acidobacteriota bacterium]